MTEWLKASVRLTEGIWGRGIAATAREAKRLAIEHAMDKLGAPKILVWRAE